MATSKQRLALALEACSCWASEKPQLLGPLEGGLTNQNFLISVAGEKYVLRLNSGHDHVWNIDRQLEQTIHQQAATAGITEKLIHTDLEQGTRVSVYRAGKTLSQKDFVEMDWLTAMGQLLHNIHGLEGAGNILNYAAHCQHFLDQLRPEPVFIQPLQDAIIALPEICSALDHQQTVCCHHDLGPYNVLTSEGQLIAIDWEYARLGFACVDISIVIDEHQLDKKQAKELLKVYRQSGGQVSKRDLKRVKPIVDLFDLLWNLLYAQLYQKESDHELIHKKVKALEKDLKKALKLS